MKSLHLNPRSSLRATRFGRARSRGTASVEFALVAPILFMFMVGAIECTRINQVNNAAAFAAYQGCRQGIIPGGTSANATAAAQSVLNANLIGQSTITINPTAITNASTTITVTVTVQLNSVCWITPMFTSGRAVSRTCTLTREKTS